MEIIKYANLALRFILELCILSALGYWGFKTGPQTIMKIVLGIGVPLVVAVVWGTFLAPASSMRLEGVLQLLLEMVIFGAAIAALYVTGHPTLAWIFALVALLNRVLMYIWNQ